MAKVGLRGVHYAILTKDDSTGVTYDVVKAISGVVTAKIQPKSNSGTLYADDGPAETDTVLGEITGDFEFSNLPVDIQADLLGHTVGADGVLVKKSTDVAPYVAIGFISQKSTTKDMYVWLYKGKAQVPGEDYKTKQDKPDFGTTTLSFTFVRREFDDAWQAVGDGDNATFTGAATWFNAVYEVNADTTAPTVTVTPNDAATGVADNSTVVWVFSEPIQKSTVTDANFFVLNPTGTQVAGALAIGADQKTVTFTPAASFAAATAYTAIATKDVKDLTGNALAQNSVTNFTTV